MKSGIFTVAALAIASTGLVACATDDSGTYRTPSSTFSDSVTSIASAAPLARSSDAIKASDSAFALNGATGSEFSIKVSDDASYTNAATEASGRCAASGKKPTAPTQKIENGQTVLAYGCI